jgi:Acetyltransferase (GNAT) domain
LKKKDFAVIYEFPDQPLEDAWRECLAQGDMPTHFAAPEYFLEPSVVDERRFAVLALDPACAAPRVLGALTGFVRGRSVVSGQIGTPQICVRKTADPEAVLSALAEGLKEVGKRAGLITVYSWFPIEVLRRSRYRESETSGTAALDLSGGPEKTFKKLKGRSQIRHAISAGIEVRQATGDDIPDYYAILKDWSERKELPCPSLDIVKASFQLSGNRRLFVAVHEGKVIAGTPVRFYAGATAEYAWNVSLPESQHLRPNDLLHWRIIEWACEQGIHTYLLGATHAFLLKYSDRVVPTYKYLKDNTFFRKYTLRESLTNTAYGLYRRLPLGVKEKLKRLRA